MPESRSPTPYVRDRAIFIVAAALGTWGYVLYSMGPTLEALRDDLGVSRTQIGFAGTALAVGSIMAALVAPLLTARLSQATLISVATGLIASSAALLAVASSLAMTLVASAILGGGGALATIIVPVIVESRHPHARAVALTEGNFSAGAAGTVAPFAIGAFTSVGLGWQAGLLVGAIGGAVGAVFAATLPPAAEPADARTVAEDGPGQQGFTWHFWRWWVCLVCGVGAEFCISFWAADFMRTAVGMSRGTASGLVAVFVAGIAVGRLVGGRLAARRRPRDLVAVSFATLLAGSMVFWGWITPMGSVVGLALLGLGISVLYPLCLSLAMESAPRGRSAKAATMISLGTSTAILAAPFVLGALGDAVGPRMGFLLIPGIASAALLVVASTLKGDERPVGPA